PSISASRTKPELVRSPGVPVGAPASPRLTTGTQPRGANPGRLPVGPPLNNGLERVRAGGSQSRGDGVMTWNLDHDAESDERVERGPDRLSCCRPVHGSE